MGHARRRRRSSRGTHGPDGRSLSAAFGNPESFRRQLESLRVTLRAFVGFRDHHRYTAADIRGLLERASELGVDEVVMTQKDAVKIPVTGPTASWRFLRIEARVARGREAYEASLARALEGGRSGAS
jgi:tetraacyldisaccharide-1-P 4'-kinase